MAKTACDCLSVSYFWPKLWHENIKKKMEMNKNRHSYLLSCHNALQLIPLR